MSAPRTDKDFKEARLAYKRDAWAKHGYIPTRAAMRDAKAAQAGCVMGRTFFLLVAGFGFFAAGCLLLGVAR